MIVDLSKYSSLKIGGVERVDIIDNIEDIKQYNQKYKNHYIVGGAYNILFSPTPPPLVMLGDSFSYIKKETIDNKEVLIVGAKTSSRELFKHCKKNDIKNFEFLYKLPATVGGLVFMNAGLKDDEICPKILSIKTSDGEILGKDLIKKCKYRDGGIKKGVLIYEVVFEIEYGFDNQKVKLYKQLRSNQPKDASAGSCFKNTKDYFVAKLLDEAGMKGKCIGNMEFSKKHCNFLINKNKIQNANNYKDAIELINLAKSKVKEKFNVDIELEIKVL